MNIENIIFDVDGTLWDSTGEVAKAWNLAVKELGIECEEITSDTLKREFGKPMNVIADHLFPSASAAEKERALELCCMYEHEVLERCEENLLYPGVKETIQELAKTHKVCVVSNCQSGYIELFLKKNQLEQYVLDTDAARRVDTVFHRMHMSLRQMVQSFGPEALPENLRLAARRTPDQRHAVIHAVLPRTERRPRLAGQCHMPWASVYWLEGREGQVVPLKESGFLGFPGFGPRWDVAANDVYGRSPAMDALPDCRMLQQMGITTLKAIHKAVDPPMSVHAGLRSVGLDLTPGGINFVDSLPGQNQPVATPLLQVKPDLAQARSAMEAVQQQIRAGLYNDLFRLILEGRSKVTASEIAAREEEKLLLIGPVLERLHDELLIPLIDRTFRLMLALDMLPPCPPELSGRHLKVEFVSLLAQAQKLVGISATDQYLALTLKAASAWPEALDSVDVDNLLDNYAQSLGLPANLTRPREERARLRAGREEARQAEQQLELLQKAADLGHTLADSDLTVEGEKSSVLQVLANLAAGAAPALRPQQTSGTTPPPEGGHVAR